jgi:putative FmdB family regulatory protein
MPVYTYRREDGTTFDQKQRFADDPLEVCPTTGQKVVRIVQNPGIIFKGSGFYVNDSKGARNGTTSKSEPKSEPETKSEAKTESKSETSASTSTEKQPSKSEAAAD